jgi:hypothetical protein
MGAGMTGHLPAPHPLLRVETPVWPELPEDDDLAAGREIILACALATLFLAAAIAAWVWLRWLS